MPLGAARITLLAFQATVEAEAEVIRSKKGVTAVGNAQVDTAQSKFGGASALFDGSGDYLSLPTAGLNLAGDFTIEFWARHNVVNDQQVYFDFRAGNTDHIIFYIKSNNTLEYYDNFVYTSTTTLAAGTWYHLALSRSGSSLKLFINGTQEWSQTNSRNHTNTGTALIGISNDILASNSMNGWLDEFRVSNTARYTANFTAPTEPFQNDANTLLLLHMDGTDGSTVFEDDNGVRAKIGVTAYGNAQVDTAQSKFGGASALFDGTGDYLQTSAQSTFTFGTGDYTMEGWIRTTTTANQGILSNRNNVISKFDNSLAIVSTYISWSNGTAWAIQDNTAIATNTWVHIAVVRSSGTVTVYKNGTSIGSTTYSTDMTGDRPIAVGALQGGDLPFNGHIDEVRISNTARYTTNFTAPTAPFVNDANTLLLIHADGTDASTVFTDDNGVRAQKGVYAIGNAQVDTAQSKFGGASLSLDGTGDYLLTAPGTYDLSGDFTLECWFYQNTTSTALKIFDGRGAASAQGGNGTLALADVLMIDNASATPYRIRFFVDGAERNSTSQSITNLAWHHMAMVRSGTTFTFYVDGVSYGTYTQSPVKNYSTMMSNYFQVIGASAGTGGFWNGWLDEFRVSNTARYTSNFTPSTTPFQNDDNTLLLLHMDGTDASTVFTDDNGVTPNWQY